jgi:histidine triad (HIT) family protein
VIQKGDQTEEECTFCQIIRGQRSADVVYEDESVVAFRDIHSAAPVHVLVVPRRHIRSLNDLTDQNGDVVAKLIMSAREIARKESVDETGYKLIFNVERGGEQLVFHLHLLGGW